MTFGSLCNDRGQRSRRWRLCRRKSPIARAWRAPAVPTELWRRFRRPAAYLESSCDDKSNRQASLVPAERALNELRDDFHRLGRDVVADREFVILRMHAVALQKA